LSYARSALSLFHSALLCACFSGCALQRYEPAPLDPAAAAQLLVEAGELSERLNAASAA